MNMNLVIAYVLVLAVFYVTMIRPQKKKKKKMEEMRNDLQKGDVVITVGGIVGTITSIKEDDIVIATGVDKNKMTLKKWGIYSKE